VFLPAVIAAADEITPSGPTGSLAASRTGSGIFRAFFSSRRIRRV
jgi:hypothetical protein